MTASNELPILIYEGPRSRIYHQAISPYGQPVVIKVLKTDHPTDDQLIRFNNEYEITRALKINGVRGSITLTRWEDKPALVLAYVAGLNLGQAFVEQKRPLVDFLQVAINIVHTLGLLHQKHIIHRDINSHNILVDLKTKKISIIDFSLASTFDLRIQHLGNPEGLDGTLAYISPEQTGRMNRVVDHRTDLYSLGATFYELLTGHLPFEINDPLALVHAHMAKVPTPVAQMNPDVPPVLSHIVMKLLAKNAEERYQSAFGVEADLERCLTTLKAVTRDEDNAALNFKLGQNDYSGQLHIPQRLYGRFDETATLLDAFERAAAGHSELMLIAGHPGVGKSALVAEIHKPITEKRGYFISGKFDPYQQHTPYAAFRQAFNQLADLLLIEPEATLKQWQDKILASIGGNGGVLTEVIPHLEKVIGPQPEVAALNGAENRNRLNVTFQNFVRALSTAGQPLVVFIDDWQWADLPSLEVLKTLLMDADNGQFLMIGAYRDDAVDSTHPFVMTLDALSEAGVPIESISLDNLKKEDVEQLIQESLICSTADSQALTELVYTKTQGNAFFTHQFLQNLFEQEWLRFNFSTHQWHWDIDQIQAQHISDNVASLMIAKLNTLGSQSARLLQLAACIGNEFDLYTLALISRMTTEAALATLTQVLRQGLLLPLDDYYKLPDTAGQARFCFLHDRVQQAACAGIPETEQQAVHLQIARLLLAHTQDADLEQRIFEIVQHYHRAAPLITTPAERLQVADLNIKAADLANQSAAFGSVQVYLEAALALMPQNAWESRYKQMLGLHSRLSTTLALTGDFDQLETVFRATQKNAHTTSDMTLATQARIQAFLSQGDFLKVIDMGVDFINELGISLKRDPSVEEARAHLKETARWLTEARIDSLAHLPAAAAKERMVFQFALAMHGPTYVAGPPVYMMLNSTLTRLCIEKGLSPEAMPALINFAFMLCLIVRDIPKALHLTRTVRALAEEKFASDSLLSFLYDIIGSYFVHRYEHLKNTLPILSEGLQKGMTSGNFELAGYAIWDGTWHQLFLGTPLDQVAVMGRRAMDTCQRMQRARVKDWCALTYQAACNLQGKSTSPWVLKGEAYDEDTQLNIALEVNDCVDTFFIFFYKGWLRYLFGFPRDATGFFREAEHYIFQGGAKYAAALLYFYDTLANAAVVVDQAADERARRLKRIDRNLEEIEVWARFAPMNHQHKKDLMLAEKARLNGAHWQAVEFYSQSIDGARDNGFLSEEALANERFGLFWLEQGRAELGRIHLRKAQNLYRLWGAKAKVNQLQVDYGSIWGACQDGPQASSAKVLKASRLQACTSSRSESDGWLDIGSILKANQSLSQTVQLTDLMAEMIHIVLENAGAQRVSILFRTKGDWFVEARGDMGDRSPQTMVHMPLHEASGLSLTICRYVIHSGQAVVLENAPKDPQFGADPYLREGSVKSVLCLPIWRKDEPRLILYLENNLVEAAFTTRRLEVLQLLSGQMAISLENALMVEQLKTSIARQKEAESALRKSEERLRLALDGTADGIWDWDTRTGKAYFSPRCYTMLGYAPDVFPPTYACWRQLIHPDDLKAAEEAVQRALTDHAAFAIEFRLKAEDGQWRWILGRGKVVELDPDGNAARVAGSHTDITDRKRMEEGLEKRILALTQPLEDMHGITFDDLFNLSDIQRLQDLYAEAFGVAALITHPDGSPITRPSNFTPLCGQIIRKNAKGLKNCNASDAMVGRHNPDGPNIHSCLSAGLCNAGASITVGGRHIANWLIGQVRSRTHKEEDMMAYAREIGADEIAVRAAYRQVPIMSQKQFDKVAQVLFAATNQLSLSAYQNVQQARFISERKKGEAALRASEARYRALVESQVDLISRYRPDTTLTFVNDAYCRFYGKTREALIGRSFLSMIAPEFREQVRKENEKLANSHRSIAGEYLNYRHDGKACWIHWIVECITDEKGRVVEIQAVGRDITERRKIEASLRRTQFCFDNASMGIFWLGEAGEILDVNEQACRRLGYSKDSLCRKTVFDIDPVFTPDMWISTREKLKNSGGVTLETFHQERTGHVFPVQVIANRMTFEDQALHVVFAQDITKRKQMQEALFESEERLDLALSGANESIWDFRLDEDALYLDSRFYTMAGYAPNAFPCNRGEVLKRIHKDDIERVNSVNDRYLSGYQDSFEVDFRFQRQDRSYMWIQAKGKIVARDDQGAPIRFVGTHADITRQKQAEAELQCLRNYLSNIINSMPSILVAVDREGRVTQWNNQAEQMIGLSFEEALGQPLTTVFPRLADQENRIRIAIGECRVIRSSNVSHQTEQETRFEDVTIFPLVGNGVEGAVIRVDDVTERVHMEEMMIQNEKMLSVGGLAAGMAHEINNPLAGILQSATVLSNRLTRDLPANQQAAVASGTTMTAIRHYMKLRKLPAMLENIRNSGTIATDIVKNMLSFARKSEQIVSKHDLCDLLDQTLELLRTDYNMKKHYDFKQIKIVRQFDKAAPKVPCEASKLQQVFMNILKNGAEAMTEYTSKERPPAFILRVKAEQTWVRVEIEDNGPGMNDATRSRIFEPFFTTKPLGRGTGLGLSVSYFIITENHGGEMDACSVDGGGTRFVIRLPKTGKQTPS